MSGEREVAITGWGTVTALGTGVDALWEGLLEGRSGFRGITLFDPRRCGASIAAEVSLEEPAPGETAGRDQRLLLTAAAEALSGAGEAFAGERSAVVLGTTLGGSLLSDGWPGTAAGSRPHGGGRRANGVVSGPGDGSRLLSRRTGARGPAWTVSVACASGTTAIGEGADLIRRGRADRVLTGGFDALSEFVVSGFGALKALTASAVRPYDARRDGLGLGEGAGCLLLEELGLARARGAGILAMVRGFATAADAHHMTRPSPAGDGLVRAMAAALESAGIAPGDVAFVLSHGTATRFNDSMESAAFHRVFGEAPPPVTSIKGAVGHTLGAAGAIETVVTALALTRGVLPPTAGFAEPDPGCPLDVVALTPRRLPERARWALKTSSGFGGANAVLVLERA